MRHPPEKGHAMTEMIKTPAGDYIHPQDFTRRRRWAATSARPPR